MVEGKLFLQIQSINTMYPEMGNMIVMLITKRIEIITSIQVCLISRMSFDYEENGGKKALPANPKHQYHVSQCGEHDCCANNNKNRDSYVHPSLSHFTDQL